MLHVRGGKRQKRQNRHIALPCLYVEELVESGNDLTVRVDISARVCMGVCVYVYVCACVC